MANDFGDAEVLFVGAFRADSVFLNEVRPGRLVDEKLEQDCRASWQKMQAEANASGQKLWESDVYRFESARTKEGKLYLETSTLPFSIRLGMNEHTNQMKNLGRAYAPKGMYTSCFIHTTDGKLLFIEKSGVYFTHKRYSFVGGVLSKSELQIQSGEDLFSAVRGEVCEEIGVCFQNTNSLCLRVGYLTENWNACLLFAVEIPYTATEAGELFSRRSDEEAESLISFSWEQLQENHSLFDRKDMVKFEIIGAT